MGQPSKAGERRRALGLPVDARDARRLEQLSEAREDAALQCVTDKILARQPIIFAQARAMLLKAVPKAVGRVVEIATGEHGRAADQLAAAKLVVEWAKFHSDGQAMIGNLSELPLGELESVLAGTLDNVRNLRAIESTSQAIEAPEDDVPTSGTRAAEPEPDATPPAAG